MLFVYMAILLFVVIIALLKGKNMLFWSLGTYLISSIIILVSLLIYNIILSVDYSLQASIFEKAGYYIILHLKFHITDVVILYNIGNFLLLSSSVIFLMISGRKISFWKILLFIPPIISLYVNMPRTKYVIWNYFMLNELENPFNVLVIANTVLLITYFVLPIIYLVFQYFRTHIFSKKKYILGTSVYILIIEISMFIVMSGSLYSNYYPLRYDVNSLPLDKYSQTFSTHMFSVLAKHPEIFLLLAIVILFYILFGDFSSTFNMRSHRGESLQSESNEMIKMIFHSYKNAFFAIERFANILEPCIDKENPNAEKALKNIKDIANTSYINSKKMTDSVILTYDFSQEKIRLNLNELLDEVMLQFASIKNLSVEKDYPPKDVYINASRQSLKEAFTNIVNNSIDALENRDDPRIKISLYLEEKSAIINFYDNGCGIDKNNIKHIFRPLFSMKNSSTNFGIGLSTALKTINYHSGTILCKSKPNEYSIFQVILPTIQ